MLRWLWKIIVGRPACNRECQWETVRKISWHESARDDLPSSFTFIQQCKTCGELKKFEA